MAYLDKFAKITVHLNSEQRKKIIVLLNNLEDIFDGTLGKCINNTPV